MAAYIRIGGRYYHLNDIGGPYGSCISGTEYQRAGRRLGLPAGIPPTPHAAVWSYTISGGTLLRRPSRIFNTTVGSPPRIPASESTALAINSAGKVVVAAGIAYLRSTPEYNDTAYFLYNMNTHTYTSLGSLMLYDPLSRGQHLHTAATTRPSTTPGKSWAYTGTPAVIGMPRSGKTEPSRT